MFDYFLNSPPCQKRKKDYTGKRNNSGEPFFLNYFQPGRGAAWIARLTGGQKAAGSIPVAPINSRIRLNAAIFFLVYFFAIMV